MGGKRVTYVIFTYQHRLTAMPFIPGTSYWCVMLGANGVANKLFLTFSSATSASSFSRMRGFFETVWRALSADPLCPGALMQIVINPSTGWGTTWHTTCLWRGADAKTWQFNKFINIVSKTDWNMSPPLHPDNDATCLLAAPCCNIMPVAAQDR